MAGGNFSKVLESIFDQGVILGYLYYLFLFYKAYPLPRWASRGACLGVVSCE